MLGFLSFFFFFLTNDFFMCFSDEPSLIPPLPDESSSCFVHTVTGSSNTKDVCCNHYSARMGKILVINRFVNRCSGVNVWILLSVGELGLRL